MHPQQPYQQQPYRSSPSPTYQQQVPGYGYPGNGYPGHQPAPQVVVRGDRNGLGTAALVLGILAVLFSLIPLIGIVAWPLGITGLILGFVGLARVNHREATNRGVTIAGLITSGVALVICVLWLVGIGVAGTRSPTGTQATIPTVAAVPAAKTNPPAAPAKPPGPATLISDGTYQVGVDMAAGRYKTPGPTDDLFRNCYWQRTRDDSGQFGSIIANGNTQGPGSVTVKTGEFFQTSGGCTWTKQ
jgi:hypothetical protein